MNRMSSACVCHINPRECKWCLERTETNPGRLERLKKLGGTPMTTVWDMSEDDLVWLIEQAERVQALEETLAFYADVNNHPVVFTAVERDGGYRARKELGRLEKWEIARE